MPEIKRLSKIVINNNENTYSLDNSYNNSYNHTMIIDTSNTLSVTEVNQNFSRAMHKADKKGRVIIFKRNKPKYMLVNLEVSPEIEMTDDEKIDFVASRILKKYRPAFEELAK